MLRVDQPAPGPSGMKGCDGIEVSQGAVVSLRFGLLFGDRGLAGPAMGGDQSRAPPKTGSSGHRPFSDGATGSGIPTSSGDSGMAGGVAGDIAQCGRTPTFGLVDDLGMVDRSGRRHDRCRRGALYLGIGSPLDTSRVG